ncbi:MAG: hypothetical protein NVV74_12745 [Magnetospirillum sp.]|nr:hypothetical protein [Magnetospirillum sp.]
MTPRDEAPQLADDLLIDAEDNPPTPVPAVPRWLLAVAILVVACNLRPPLTSVGPVLNEIRAALPGLGGLVGLLTMLPVLCMGLAGPLAPVQARRWGAERVVLGWMAVLAAGLALRAIGTPLPLFLGTAIVGSAIGVVGVLLPGLVKRDFRDHGTLMTGLFTMALCWGAAFAAGVMVPLAQFLGGSWSLGAGRLGGAGRRRHPGVGAHGAAQGNCRPRGGGGQRGMAAQAGLAGHPVHGAAILAGLCGVRLAGAHFARPRP